MSCSHCPQKFRPRLHVTVEDLENILDETGQDLLAQRPVSNTVSSSSPAGELGCPADRRAEGNGRQAKSYAIWRRGSMSGNTVESGLAGGSEGGGGNGSGSGNDSGLWGSAAGAVAAVSAFRLAASRRFSTIGGSLTNVVLTATGGTAASTNNDDSWPESPESATAAAARGTAVGPIRPGHGLTAVDGERRLGPHEFELVLRQQMTLFIQARYLALQSQLYFPFILTCPSPPNPTTIEPA
jgi:hypothetical protein